MPNLVDGLASGFKAFATTTAKNQANLTRKSEPTQKNDMDMAMKLAAEGHIEQAQHVWQNSKHLSQIPMPRFRGETAGTKYFDSPIDGKKYMLTMKNGKPVETPIDNIDITSPAHVMNVYGQLSKEIEGATKDIMKSRKELAALGYDIKDNALLPLFDLNTPQNEVMARYQKLRQSQGIMSGLNDIDTPEKRDARANQLLRQITQGMADIKRSHEQIQPFRGYVSQLGQRLKDKQRGNKSEPIIQKQDKPAQRIISNPDEARGIIKEYIKRFGGDIETARKEAEKKYRFSVGAE